MTTVFDIWSNLWTAWLGPQWGPLAWTLVKNTILILCIVLPLFACVAYLTLWERKLIGWMQIRLGPNRVGPLGLLQPLAAWAVIPFSPEVVLADVNAGLLYVMAITSMGVYGIIIAGWASNSKYAFLGAMRSAAQIVAYEIAMGFALVCVLMVSQSLNLTDIVAGQQRGTFAHMGLNFLSWNWLPLAPMFLVYFISGVAETNRAPFDVAEGESEIVAGFHVEYSGMPFALFFLGEYANMILVSALATVMFLGGWAAPVDAPLLDAIPPFAWLFAKIFFMVSLLLWFRATFPRYRYDQIMRLGWKVFIPLTIVWLVVIAVWMRTPWNIWT